mgnify:FL=1
MSMDLISLTILLGSHSSSAYYKLILVEVLIANKTQLKYRESEGEWDFHFAFTITKKSQQFQLQLQESNFAWLPSYRWAF